MIEHIAGEGETLDYIVWKHYGNTDGRRVETVLAANHGLAGMGPVLPAGTRVVLPEITDAQAAKPGIHLWD